MAILCQGVRKQISWAIVQLAARDLLYTPSHRQDSTTSHEGTLSMTNTFFPVDPINTVDNGLESNH